MRKRERRSARREDIGSPAKKLLSLHTRSARLFRAGRHLEAQVCCQQALAIDADHADTSHLMGCLSLEAGNNDHALEWFARAISRDPQPDYLVSLATTLRRLNRHDDALKAIDKAIQRRPGDALLWRDLADVLAHLGRDGDALLGYQHALVLAPRFLDAANKCAALLEQFGRLQEALECLNLSDELQPDHGPTLQARALLQRRLGREDYYNDSLRAHVADPASAQACNMVGDALQANGREEEALQWFDKALDLSPGDATVLNNKAFSLSQLQRFDEALALYDRIKTTDPTNAVAEWNLALQRILTGDFEAGWAGREARWKIPSLSGSYPRFSQPMWSGREDVSGRTILVHVDEGLGDTIQFARYVPRLAARGACVVLVVVDALQPLLAGMPGVSQCLSVSDATLPPFDMHCPLSRLPVAFGTTAKTIPAETPYLPRPDEQIIQAWERRLGRHDRLRVGLVWSGNPGHRNDHNRSIPLQQLEGLLDADATFVSLQKETRPVDCAVLLRRTDLIDVAAHLTNFVETAALVSCLDLVVTVDTSVAHLAAALGRPTWIMLPWTPDYRWQLDRDDSPWYLSVRLFRQDATRDYAPVIERVRDALLTTILDFQTR